MLKFIFIASLLSFSVAKADDCTLTWKKYTPGKDDAAVSTDAFYAGDFDKGVPIYIGRGLVREYFIPGRIQIGKNASFFYSRGHELETIDEHIEYLYNNRFENSFEWVDDDVCVSNGVRVGDKYYIGKVTEGDKVFIGKVNMGRNGLYYENSAGKVVLTNKYQVLTCKDTSTRCSGDLFDVDIRVSDNDTKQQLKEAQDRSRQLEVQNNRLNLKNADMAAEIKHLEEQVQKLKEDIEYGNTVAYQAV